MVIQARSPYDQQIVCSFEHDEGAALEKKVSLVHAAFEDWRRVPLGDRIEEVRGALERLWDRSETLALDVTRQMGKPITEARVEVETVFSRAEQMLFIGEETLSPDVLDEVDGFHRRIEHSPLGVVLNLSAWNYPLIIPVNVVVPALIAGNTVLIKHSSRTPLCGQAFEDAFRDLSVENLVTHLVLTHQQTARLISDERIAHVSFTGSVDGGAAVHREVGKRFIDVGLELGGKDPAYVAEDADLPFAIAGTVEGACYNAGQSCCAVERIYVHRNHYDAYLDGVQQALGAWKMGNPLEEETTLGPLASRSALDLLERQVADALARGADLVEGGTRIPDVDGNFFPPTLLAGVPNHAEAMQEESFGPLIPVLSVDSDEEALALMKETRFGLTASVWTGDRERAERFARQIDAGTIFQNRCDFLDPALPWTGHGDSGKGSTLSPYGYLHLTRRKAIHFRLET